MTALRTSTPLVADTLTALVERQGREWSAYGTQGLHQFDGLKVSKARHPGASASAGALFCVS
jgi:hypothetical protein